MLLTNFKACTDAQLTWLRVVGILRMYWSQGKQWEGQPSGGWYVGDVVEGGESDSFEALDYAVSADMAMNKLRRIAPVAFTLACKEIEEPNRPYHTERGLGVADLLRLSVQDAAVLLERAKEYVYSLMEREGPAPTEGLR